MGTVRRRPGSSRRRRSRATWLCSEGSAETGGAPPGRASFGTLDGDDPPGVEQQDGEEGAELGAGHGMDGEAASGAGRLAAGRLAAVEDRRPQQAEAQSAPSHAAPLPSG
ncbi:hypothetical protein STENM223S_08925 [Streptomyces tendae]